MEIGDVCVYELSYSGTNKDLKVKFTKMSDVEVMLADGFS